MCGKHVKVRVPALKILLFYPSYQRWIRRISFVTFVEINAKSLLTVVSSGHSIIAATTPQFL
jgi:hypothetical protein